MVVDATLDAVAKGLGISGAAVALGALGDTLGGGVGLGTVGRWDSNAVSLAVDIALRASLVASQLRGLSGAHGDSSSRGRGGLGSSHDGEEAGEEDGETHGDGSEGFSFCWVYKETG